MVLMFGIMFTYLGNIEPINIAIEKLNNNPVAISYLEENIEKDSFWFSGSISISGSEGEAKVSFPVEGNRGEGTLYMMAEKEIGVWKIKKLVLEIGDKNYRINILRDSSRSI